MPLYDYLCLRCGAKKEVLAKVDDPAPVCCGGVMTHQFTIDSLKIVEWSQPLWAKRIDEIHKRQADKGERLRLPHPKEVRAS